MHVSKVQTWLPSQRSGLAVELAMSTRGICGGLCWRRHEGGLVLAIGLMVSVSLVCLGSSFQVGP